MEKSLKGRAVYIRAFFSFKVLRLLGRLCYIGRYDGEVFGWGIF